MMFKIVEVTEHHIKVDERISGTNGPIPQALRDAGFKWAGCYAGHVVVGGNDCHSSLKLRNSDALNEWFNNFGFEREVMPFNLHLDFERLTASMGGDDAEKAFHSSLEISIGCQFMIQDEMEDKKKYWRYWDKREGVSGIPFMPTDDTFKNEIREVYPQVRLRPYSRSEMWSAQCDIRMTQGKREDGGDWVELRYPFHKYYANSDIQVALEASSSVCSIEAQSGHWDTFTGPPMMVLEGSYWHITTGLHQSYYVFGQRETGAFFLHQIHPLAGEHVLISMGWLWDVQCEPEQDKYEVTVGRQGNLGFIRVPASYWENAQELPLDSDNAYQLGEWKVVCKKMLQSKAGRIPKRFFAVDPVPQHGGYQPEVKLEGVFECRMPREWFEERDESVLRKQDIDAAIERWQGLNERRGNSFDADTLIEKITNRNISFRKAVRSLENHPGEQRKHILSQLPDVIEKEFRELDAAWEFLKKKGYKEVSKFVNPPRHRGYDAFCDKYLAHPRVERMYFLYGNHLSQAIENGFEFVKNVEDE